MSAILKKDRKLPIIGVKQSATYKPFIIGVIGKYNEL